MTLPDDPSTSIIKQLSDDPLTPREAAERPSHSFTSRLWKTTPHLPCLATVIDDPSPPITHECDGRPLTPSTSRMWQTNPHPLYLTTVIDDPSIPHILPEDPLHPFTTPADDPLSLCTSRRRQTIPSTLIKIPNDFPRLLAPWEWRTTPSPFTRVREKRFHVLFSVINPFTSVPDDPI